MSLLPPPPAPQQQRRPVRSTTSVTTAMPPSASRGLYSDAVGLRTGLSADALRHPTASVGLHDGPTFAPQHRPVAQHAPLDIGAMVAARLSLPEPEVDTAGKEDKKRGLSFSFGKKKDKGAATGPGEKSPAKEGPGALEKVASSAKDLVKKGMGSMDAQWKAANKEDAITGMDKYDYTFIASKPSIMASERVSMRSKAMVKLGSRDKEDVQVLFGGEAIRAAQFEAMLKTDDDNGAIALLATIDKTWDPKEQAFQIQSVQDKIKTFDAVDTYKIPPGAGANSNLVTSLRDYWVTTEHAQGIVDAKTVHDYPKRVAELQDAAKMHVRRYDSEKLKDTKDDKWVSGSPHPLSMGQAAMVDVTNDEATLPAHIEAFVGKPFLNYITSTYMQAGRNKRATKPQTVEVVDPDSNTPFIIPIGSMYDTSSKAYATLSAARLAPAGDLHCVNALLVVQVPPDSDDRLKQAFGLTGSNNDLEVEWSRIAPYQVNPGFKGQDDKVPFTDPFQEKHLTVVEGTDSAEIDKLVAEAERRKDENIVTNTKLTPEEKTRLDALNKDATDEFYKKDDNMAKATWKETVSGFEKKNNIAIYGLHLDYQCFQDPSKSKDDCAPKKIMISKHPLFIRPFGGSDVADFEAPSPKDLMRIWTIGEGNKLLNALPLALKGQGFDCRFLWAALKLAQRSFRTAQGKAKPGVKQVLNLKGGKVTTATRAKHRWLNGLKAKKSQKPGTLASFEGDYDDIFVGCCFSDDEEE